MSMPRRAKICQSYFRFWPILSTPGSSSSGLSAASASLFRNLIRAELGFRREQVAAALRRRPRGGRSARSRPRCRRPRARSRTAARPSDRGWWSRCRPRRRRCRLARATQALSRSSVRTVSYLLRSILLALRGGEMRGGQRRGRRASPRCRSRLARAAAAAARTDRRSCRSAIAGRLRPRWRADGAAVALRPTSACASASISLASMPDFSATRRVSVVNSIALRKAISRL